MKTLEEIALQVAKEMPNEFLWCSWCRTNEDGVLEQEAVEFARRLVAALGAQEPIGNIYKDGTCAIADDYRGRLYAAPVVKEGEVVVTTDENGRAVAVTRQDEEGRVLSVIWEAALEAAAKIGAPNGR